MAAADINILSIARAFDELSSPIERLLKHPKDKADGDEQASTRFVLDNDFFYHVQTHVKTGAEFPDDKRLFEKVYSPDYFKSWLQEDVEYRKMWQGVTAVSQHCRFFLHEGIYRIINLAHYINSFSSDVVDLLEVLAEMLRIISDRSVPFSSGEATDARLNIKEILQVLQDSSLETSKRTASVLKETERFAVTTSEDQVVLDALNELLKNLVPKDVDTDNWEKWKGLQSIQKITALAPSHKAVQVHIDAMRKALTEVHDALTSMDTTTSRMIKAVSLMGDQARPERADYGVAGAKLGKAVATCKQVAQLAQGFAKQAAQS
ncbi:hypothetical protein N0V84_005310 [Fusarium piperis]|uniref:Uncharacterized protein n=1 Tax=Fusarium piperis TaxID=1435070 RepID=A0A9W9BQE9_9HYPO|nr:hypothetical protein N0V84_005310 [Fusarium piperis]